MTADQTLLLLVAFLVALALSYVSWTRGHRAGVKQGRREGVTERHALVVKLGELERLGESLGRQLVIAHAAEAVHDASRADLPAEPVPAERSVSPLGDRLAKRVRDGADAAGARSYDGTVGGESSYGAADSVPDVPELVEVDPPEDKLAAARSRLSVPINEFDGIEDPNTSRSVTESPGTVADAKQYYMSSGLPPAQTERVEDPAKPGEIDYGSEPHHD